MSYTGNPPPVTKTTKEKRPISKLMAASAFGVTRDSREVMEVPLAAPVNIPVPQIVEQFLSQRPLPKFTVTQLPSTSPTDAEFFSRRRNAGGFDNLVIFKKNYVETLSQLQLFASKCGTTVNWQFAFETSS